MQPNRKCSEGGHRSVLAALMTHLYSMYHRRWAAAKQLLCHPCGCHHMASVLAKLDLGFDQTFRGMQIKHGPSIRGTSASLLQETIDQQGRVQIVSLSVSLPMLAPRFCNKPPYEI